LPFSASKQTFSFIVDSWGLKISILGLRENPFWNKSKYLVFYQISQKD